MPLAAPLILLTLLLFPVEYGPALEASTSKDVARRFEAAFDPTTANLMGAQNCKQVSAMKGPKTKSTATLDSQVQRFETATCLALGLMQRARPAKFSFVHRLAWNPSILNLLPPQLAILISNDSIRNAEAASAQNKSYLQFDDSLKATSAIPGELRITGDSFTQTLILLGRADFDGNGLEDLLVQSLDALTGGTYRHTRLYLLTRTSAARAKLTISRTLL